MIENNAQKKNKLRLRECMSLFSIEFVSNYILTKMNRRIMILLKITHLPTMADLPVFSAAGPAAIRLAL